MSLVDGYTYLDTQLIRALTDAACEGPTEEQVAAAPEALVRYCLTGPRQVRDLYPWGQRRRYRPRMVRALVRDLVEREQLAASDPVGLADWSWVWHPDTATGPGTPPPLDPAELVAAPEEAEPVEEPEGEDDEEPAPAVEEEDDGLTRDQRRSARPREVRAQTQSVRTTSKRSLLVGAALYPEGVPPLPATRAECVDGPRPCPRVSCRHHLYLDVHPRTGAIKLNFPDLEVEQMAESCSLDLAEQGPLPLRVVGAALNLTRERIRRLEGDAAKRLLDLADEEGIDLEELLDGREVSALHDRQPAMQGGRHAIKPRHLRLVTLMGDREWKTPALVEEVQAQGWDLSYSGVRVLVFEAKTLGLISQTARGVYRAVRKVEAAE